MSGRLAFLFCALLPAAAFGSGESLSVYQMRIRVGNTTDAPKYYEAAFVVQRDEPVAIPDLDLLDPNGVSWMEAGAARSVAGLAPYDDVRSILADGRRYRALRVFGKTKESPFGDGTWRARSVSLGFEVTADVSAPFPEYPLLLSPTHKQKVGELLSIEVAEPAAAPDFVWVSVIRKRKGRLDFPPLFFDQQPWSGAQFHVPSGLLEPRGKYFVLVGFGAGSRISATAVAVRAKASGGVLATHVDEAGATKDGSTFSFVRKGALPDVSPKTLAGVGTTLVFEVGSLDPVSIPLSDLSAPKQTVEVPAHPFVDDVRVDWEKGRFRLRGVVDRLDRLGEIDDVRVKVKNS